MRPQPPLSTRSVPINAAACLLHPIACTMRVTRIGFPHSLIAACTVNPLPYSCGALTDRHNSPVALAQFLGEHPTSYPAYVKFLFASINFTQGKPDNSKAFLVGSILGLIHQSHPLSEVPVFLVRCAVMSRTALVSNHPSTCYHVVLRSQQA